MDILGYLPPEDLVNMRRVSTRLARLAGDKKLWRRTFIYDMNLYRAEEEFSSSDLVNLSRKELPSARSLALLTDVAGDDLAFIVCQVQVADFSYLLWSHDHRDFAHHRRGVHEKYQPPRTALP